jgi:hypothetical protein
MLKAIPVGCSGFTAIGSFALPSAQSTGMLQLRYFRRA